MKTLIMHRYHYTDHVGRRRKTRYLLTAEDAEQRLKDPVLIANTREERHVSEADLTGMLGANPMPGPGSNWAEVMDAISRSRVRS